MIPCEKPCEKPHEPESSHDKPLMHRAGLGKNLNRDNIGPKPLSGGDHSPEVVAISQGSALEAETSTSLRRPIFLETEVCSENVATT